MPLLIPEDIKIYLHIDPTDMRKSINTLSVLISDTLKLDPSSGHLFLFRNRKGDKMKALYYEQNCFSLWYRRLEQGKFIFPKDKTGSVEITEEHFRWLLSSDKYSRLEAMEIKKYESFY